jgi:Arc/MetJ-type ribon-helix-helix transcriptional regulator
MVNQLISVRVPDNMFNAINEYSELGGFSSIQELIRESIREYIRKQKMEQLMALAGSVDKSKVKIATKKELSALAKKLYFD